VWAEDGFRTSGRQAREVLGRIFKALAGRNQGGAPRSRARLIMSLPHSRAMQKDRFMSALLVLDAKRERDRIRRHGGEASLQSVLTERLRADPSLLAQLPFRMDRDGTGSADAAIARGVIRLLRAYRELVEKNPSRRALRGALGLTARARRRAIRKRVVNPR
jgi:hypothetical protein